MEKYKEHSNKILKLLEDIFGWLPLGTVINNKIFVTHGGISNITDLEIINRIDRHKVGHILVICMQLFFAYVPFILTVQSIKFCMVHGCSCFLWRLKAAKSHRAYTFKVAQKLVSVRSTFNSAMLLTMEHIPCAS